MVVLAELLRQYLCEADVAETGAGKGPPALLDFEGWLENALDKAPDYGLDELAYDLAEVFDDYEYEPPPYIAATLNQPKQVDTDADAGLGQYDREWLMQKCASTPSALTVGELCESIMKTLQSDPKGEIEGNLVDLLGFESIELVSQLLINKEKIIEAQKGQNYSQKSRPHPLAAMAILAPALPGQSISLVTKAMKEEQKMYRKMQSKGLIPEEVYEDRSVDSERMHVSLQQALGSQSGAEKVLPNVYVSKRPENMHGGKFALPSGTVHNDFTTHEEFIIPYPTDIGNITAGIALVEISQLDSILQRGFQGYRTLNKMQSVVYPVAHYTNENMLVCAPTGAGKTDVAMLTVLKVIRDHITGGSGDRIEIARDAFKIVYIAPMKALAAEIAEKFSVRLRPFGVKVREYTGDMQLNRREINETQMMVTTPEKWDVITRKGLGDVDLVQKVKLLIIDEVHLLQDDRGPVIETIVARTLREVEISQRLVRIVSLSATLPNYIDVAAFLRVDFYTGLFVFGDAFRPVPLTQQFIGAKGRGHVAANENINRVCFQKCHDFVREGHQVMIFVHSRVETARTAKTMLKQASEQGVQGLFSPPDKCSREYADAQKVIEKSRNRELQALFPAGFAFHHAGMLRSDRTMVEKLFRQGHIRVLVCTATLAWGVNLPAHAVIIKGTQVYDQQKGDFVNLGVLDVLQIFGRAGRPQFETHGEGLIITTHDQLAKYINAVMSQVPIESQFLHNLPDNLNAEVALGTVATIQEGVSWLKYSYLYVRMRRNPNSYGLTPKDLGKDPELFDYLLKICRDTALKLRNSGMVSFDPTDPAGVIRIRDVGRIASSFYLTRMTMETFGSSLKPIMTEEDILAVVSTAAEFGNLRVREEELRELDALLERAPLRVKHDVTTSSGKASLLILAYISHYELDSFSLISDTNYVAQNAGRVLRALYEIIRTQRWMKCAARCLKMCKAFERRVWPMQHPLCQLGKLSIDVCKKLDSKNPPMETLSRMGKKDIGMLLDNARAAELVKTLSGYFPTLELSARLYPVNKQVLKVDLLITPAYFFREEYHGFVDLWWIFVENPLLETFLHFEEFTVNKRQCRVPRALSFFIPIQEPFPPQIYIHAISDRWMHAENTLAVSFQHLLLPEEMEMKHTKLLPLRPLPITALNDLQLEKLYSPQFMFFNSVQTQVFHKLYYCQENIMVGAPTGSGKTVIAELAIWNALRTHPSSKAVYIAPLKALIKERLKDWGERLGPLGISVVELTGDFTPDLKSIQKSHLIVTTPEKWDSVSRKWPIRSFVSQISLIVMDEIHLLGGERGHVLEMIVSRMRRVVAKDKLVRLVGLSTALANSSDLAQWLDINDSGLFNFRPAVRPVPLEVRIEGYAGRHYCPRMAAMNKPAYSAISSYSPEKPALIFVSSRRQTRLTANALIAYCVHDNLPRRFVRMEEHALECVLDRVVDGPLKLALNFGIALHHAGLVESDRLISEELFANSKVQVMIATSTLAWGVNFPAHLVVVKGTEYYDARSQGYINYPLTDVMQMIGRAGRPQFDQKAVAVLLVQDSKKEFYKKFLYESFPLESSLHLKSFFAEHLNAEIAGGSVKSVGDATELLKGTYLAVRLKSNPNYYGPQNSTGSFVEDYLLAKVEESLASLLDAQCIKWDRQSGEVESLELGIIASSFYLSHRTIKIFAEHVGPEETFSSLLRTLSCAAEFDETPVRHNEDHELLNFSKASLRAVLESIAGPLFFSEATEWNDPHTKVFVLLVAYFSGTRLPIADLITDTKSILEQCARIVQAVVEIARARFFLETFVSALQLQQSLAQGILPQDCSAAQLPHVERGARLDLSKLLGAGDRQVQKMLQNQGLNDDQVSGVLSVLRDRLPCLKIAIKLESLEILPCVAVVCIKDSRKKEVLGLVYHRGSAKIQKETWRLVIGDPSRRALLSHVKCQLDGRTIRVPFFIPDNGKIDDLKLYCISENYLGLDQQLPLRSAS